MTTRTATTDPASARLSLTARQIMERRVIAVSPSAPLSEVERLLTEHRISGMPVTDSAGRAVGVISYRDLLDHYADDPDSRPQRGPHFFRLSTEHLADEDFEAFTVPEESEDRVEDLMTTDVISVGADATVLDIAELMSRRGIHRVLVTDPETTRVIGLVGSLNLLAAIAGTRPAAADVPAPRRKVAARKAK